MPDVRFSIIIPTYNRDDLVAETLDTVFEQRFTDYEVIVVDDGSTDGTLDVVRGYGDRIRIIEQDHKGCAAARNLGARHASGEYLAFLDSDDLWRPWTLAVFDRAIREAGPQRGAGGPAFVAGRLFNFTDAEQAYALEEEPVEVVTGPDFFSTAIKAGFGLGVAHGVVRRDVYLSVGGCEEINVNGTDSDVLLKLGDAPGFALIKQPVTLAYRKHTGRTTMNHEKTLGAVRMLLGNEAEGRYPGGPERKAERMSHILFRTRGMSRVATRFGAPSVAWKIYRQTVGWNLRQGRWRYSLAMPPLIIGATLKGWFTRGE